MNNDFFLININFLNLPSFFFLKNSFLSFKQKNCIKQIGYSSYFRNEYISLNTISKEIIDISLLDFSNWYFYENYSLYLPLYLKSLINFNYKGYFDFNLFYLNLEYFEKNILISNCFKYLKSINIENKVYLYRNIFTYYRKYEIFYDLKYFEFSNYNDSIYFKMINFFKKLHFNVLSKNKFLLNKQKYLNKQFFIFKKNIIITFCNDISINTQKIHFFFKNIFKKKMNFLCINTNVITKSNNYIFFKNKKLFITYINKNFFLNFYFVLNLLNLFYLESFKNLIFITQFEYLLNLLINNLISIFCSFLLKNKKILNLNFKFFQLRNFLLNKINFILKKIKFILFNKKFFFEKKKIKNLILSILFNYIKFFIQKFLFKNILSYKKYFLYDIFFNFFKNLNFSSKFKNFNFYLQEFNNKDYNLILDDIFLNNLITKSVLNNKNSKKFSFLDLNLCKKKFCFIYFWNLNFLNLFNIFKNQNNFNFINNDFLYFFNNFKNLLIYNNYIYLFLNNFSQNNLFKINYFEKNYYHFFWFFLKKYFNIIFSLKLIFNKIFLYFWDKKSFSLIIKQYKYNNYFFLDNLKIKLENTMLLYSRSKKNKSNFYNFNNFFSKIWNLDFEHDSFLSLNNFKNFKVYTLKFLKLFKLKKLSCSKSKFQIFIYLKFLTNLIKKLILNINEEENLQLENKNYFFKNLKLKILDIDNFILFNYFFLKNKNFFNKINKNNFFHKDTKLINFNLLKNNNYNNNILLNKYYFNFKFFFYYSYYNMNKFNNDNIYLYKCNKINNNFIDYYLIKYFFFFKKFLNKQKYFFFIYLERFKYLNLFKIMLKFFFLKQNQFNYLIKYIFYSFKIFYTKNFKISYSDFDKKLLNNKIKKYFLIKKNNLNFFSFKFFNRIKIFFLKSILLNNIDFKKKIFIRLKNLKEKKFKLFFFIKKYFLIFTKNYIFNNCLKINFLNFLIFLKKKLKFKVYFYKQLLNNCFIFIKKLFNFFYKNKINKYYKHLQLNNKKKNILIDKQKYLIFLNQKKLNILNNLNTYIKILIKNKKFDCKKYMIEFLKYFDTQLNYLEKKKFVYLNYIKYIKKSKESVFNIFWAYKSEKFFREINFYTWKFFYIKKFNHLFLLKFNKFKNLLTINKETNFTLNLLNSFRLNLRKTLFKSCEFLHQNFIKNFDVKKKLDQNFFKKIKILSKFWSEKFKKKNFFGIKQFYLNSKVSKFFFLKKNLLSKKYYFKYCLYQRYLNLIYKYILQTKYVYKNFYLKNSFLSKNSSLNKNFYKWKTLFIQNKFFNNKKNKIKHVNINEKKIFLKLPLHFIFKRLKFIFKKITTLIIYFFFKWKNKLIPNNINFNNIKFKNIKNYYKFFIFVLKGLLIFKRIIKFNPIFFLNNLKKNNYFYNLNYLDFIKNNNYFYSLNYLKNSLKLKYINIYIQKFIFVKNKFTRYISINYKFKFIFFFIKNLFKQSLIWINLLKIQINSSYNLNLLIFKWFLFKIIKFSLYKENLIILNKNHLNINKFYNWISLSCVNNTVNKNNINNNNLDFFFNIKKNWILMILQYKFFFNKNLFNNLNKFLLKKEYSFFNKNLFNNYSDKFLLNFNNNKYLTINNIYFNKYYLFRLNNNFIVL